MAMQMDAETQSGKYVVSSGDKSTTVDADRWDYSARDELQFWQGSKIVATFRWWDSIVAKN